MAPRLGFDRLPLKTIPYLIISPSMPPAIIAQGISKAFRTGIFGPPKQVLYQVDLEVEEGAI